MGTNLKKSNYYKNQIVTKPTKYWVVKKKLKMVTQLTTKNYENKLKKIKLKKKKLKKGNEK